MSTKPLELPRLGETMEEGQIVRWLKAPGDEFVRGETLLEVETDKTLVEVPALSSGRLVEILVPEGQTVAVGTAIAQVTGEGTAKAVSGKPEEKADTQSQPAPAVRTAAAEPVPTIAGAPVRATPLARRIARDAGLAIADISGSGRRGRVEAADVRKAISEPSKARTVASDDISFLELGDERLAYVDAGPKDGPPVLLLHGFGADHTAFAALTASLARSGCRAVVPDLAGHGRTSLAAETPDDLVNGLGELMRHLKITRGLQVVAHSLGSAAALALAERKDIEVSRLTLLAPAGMGYAIDTGFISGLANAGRPGEVSHLLRRLSVRGAMLGASALDALAKELSRKRLVALADTVAGPGGQRIDLLPVLAGIAKRMPVEVIVGIEDRIIPWTEISGLPPRVAIHLLARAGHIPHWDQLEDVVDLIVR